MKRKLYFAGGWFNFEQEKQHTRLVNFLNDLDMFKIFNPRIHGEFEPGKGTDKMTQVLLNNIEAIENCDIMVAITDHKDMGTLWETGFAYGINKPVIYICESLNGKPFNLMLAKTGRVATNAGELEYLLNDESSFVFNKFNNEYKGDIE